MLKLNRKAAAGVAALMALSYVAGTAQAGPNETVMKLDQSADLLKKARAILNSTVTRAGYGNIDKAKLQIDGALSEIEKAKAAIGG